MKISHKILSDNHKNIWKESNLNYFNIHSFSKLQLAYLDLLQNIYIYIYIYMRARVFNLYTDYA